MKPKQTAQFDNCKEANRRIMWVIFLLIFFILMVFFDIFIQQELTSSVLERCVLK